MLHLQFYVPTLNSSEQINDKATCLQDLQASWPHFSARANANSDQEWADALDLYLQNCVASRLDHVQHWLDVNTARFSTDPTTFQVRRREYEALAVTMKAGVQLCKLECAECNLLCLKSRHHEGLHDCSTSHCCTHQCVFAEEHSGEDTPCGLP